MLGDGREGKHHQLAEEIAINPTARKLYKAYTGRLERNDNEEEFNMLPSPAHDGCLHDGVVWRK